ncbi:shikimate kinase [Brachyspira hampsonii]|uniref:Shikimate kinase n=1 Tax=Brachyspira hampsonii TaxID=1287055 RepID=A0AAC9TRX0_9SPIR|nr:shikimate kinase [Brachyspira hampsonii]ASJ20860.1 shikimate kinase [Brachyspira hampsonii]ELV04962.1 shikimate kinase [Brachyspira hampsonii 30599]MBW5379517.1 shikimate kinase [Brachyspira hampsonii]MBW5411063.1 shikimate kinase [Brachyspira hampsonii]OEJ18941.1 shikimate kinase [Brachyspira hampsonii]
MNNKDIKNSKIIFIIGLPGCGKSALSKMLAKKLNYQFYDMDSFIEDKEGSTITEIFANNGETYFRNLESDVLQELSSLSNAVISTGGGIVLSEKNRNIMKDKGLTIFVDRNPDIILENIDPSQRPLLAKDKNKLLELSKQRDRLYRESAHIIFTHHSWEDNIDNTFKKFYESIKNYC